MYKNIVFVLIILLSVSFVAAQETDSLAQVKYSQKSNYDYYRSATYTPDPELVKKYNPRKPIWIPLLESVGQNVVTWAFNRYISDAPHAYISIETIKDHFKQGWGWDVDNLITNMFLHPFGGALSTTIGREPAAMDIGRLSV